MNKLAKKLNINPDLIRGILGIFTYLYLNFASSQIFRLFGIQINKLSKPMVALVSIIYSFIILVILLLISKEKYLNNLKEYKKNFKAYFKRNVKYWLSALLIMAASNLIIYLIFNSETSANDATIRQIFDNYPLYMVIQSIIIAPLTEEIVFRQSIRYLVKNNILFIIISGLVFGGMHTITSLNSVADFLYIIPYSVPGMFFAYMLVKEDNVLVPITFHTIHNSLSTILLLLAKLTGIF